VRILFALPGLHRYHRGAELAFISIARELCKLGESVTLIGSGAAEKESPYRFLRANSVPRERFERFPFFPFLRNECCYEDLTFAPSLAWRYRPSEYDITVTCSYPFTNWVLRRAVMKGSSPPHVFVTQNGDWAPLAKRSSAKSEYRFFGCEGLVCINPDFFERNKDAWNCRLIPNGVDCDRFRPGTGHRAEFGLPEDRFIVLMVSALIPSKRVEVGIEAVSRIPDAHLVVAGDGPLRASIASAATVALPGRFTRVSLAPERMPILYQSAHSCTARRTSPSEVSSAKRWRADCPSLRTTCRECAGLSGKTSSWSIPTILRKSLQVSSVRAVRTTMREFGDLRERETYHGA